MQQTKVPTVRLADLMITLGRRWPVILVTTLFCAALGFVLGVTAPRNYTATATLTVSPITTSPFSSAAVNQQINITTERAILSSGEVAAIAAKELGEKVSSGSLQSNTETAAPSGSQILEVSVTLADPQRAADQANALAKAYLQFRSEGAAEVAAGYIVQIDERLKGLNDQASLTESQVQQRQDLQQQKTSLTLASASPGRLIGTATAPDQQSSMGALVFMAAGTMGGLLLGLALAMVREGTDPKVRTAARLRGLFDNNLVVLNDEDPEPVRWLVRTVRLTGTQNPHDTTVFVGVITLSGGGPAQLTPWLVALAKRHDLTVAAVSGRQLSAKAVDLGWPVRGGNGRWEENDVVFVEVGSSITDTRLADLADRMDVLFISAGKRTPLKLLKQTLALVHGISAERITPILYTPGPRRKSIKHQSRAPARSSQEAPERAGATTDIPPSSADGRTPTMAKGTAIAALMIDTNSRER